MSRFTDTQLIVLAAAAARDDQSILPLPDTIRGGAATKLVEGLIRRGLAERITSVPELIRITRAGLEAIGIAPENEVPAGTPAQAEAEPPATSKRPPKGTSTEPADGQPNIRAGTKQAKLIEMLRAEGGATIDEIAAATGWQSHTIRGAMSGALKKKLGLEIMSEKVEGRGRVYSLPRD